MTDNTNTVVRRWEGTNRYGEDNKKSLTWHWQSFIDSRVREWSTVTATGSTLSTNVGRIPLLCAGPGILCALATVFISLVYVRNRHLLERIMQDKGPIDLPFNLWTFLSLPSLYFTWSLLLLGFVLFFCLFTPGHQPFSWDVAILGIPIPVLSTGLSLLVTLIPCSLVARNLQVLAQAIEQPTTPKPSGSKPMDLLPPSDLESTELVTPEKLLGLVPIAAHVIIGFSLALLAIGDFYSDPITRISLITAITAAFFVVILHLQASLQLSAYTKQAIILPVVFLALSPVASLFGLVAWPIRRLLS